MKQADDHHKGNTNGVTVRLRRPDDPTPPALGKLTRRDAMKTLLGASAALAVGVAGCERKPRRQIVSRVDGPEYQKPGKALYYSSTWTEGSIPYGLMIKTVDGRPIKIEGNPNHPLNPGTSNHLMQASTLSLYDPDRMRGASRAGTGVSWKEADDAIVSALRAAATAAVVTGAGLGPSEQALVKRMLARLPGARHFVHESVNDRPQRTAWRAMFGQEGVLVPMFEKANVILSLDADFLGAEGVTLEAIRGFAAGRRIEPNPSATEPFRFYAAEGAMTVTGGNADYRLRLRPSLMGSLAGAIRLAVDGKPESLHRFAEGNGLSVIVLKKLVADLTRASKNALVVAGEHLPPSAHAQVALLNERLGALGNTLVWSSEPGRLPISDPGEMAAFFAKGVDVAVFLDVNPVYDWPGGGFEKLMAKSRLSVVHGLLPNETVARSHIALASAHNLESWNDARPRKGIDTLCQPMIAPLFDSRQCAESLFQWTRALSPERDPLREVPDWHGFMKERWTHPIGIDDSLAPALEDGLPLAQLRGWERVLQTGGVFAEVKEPMPPFDRSAAETFEAPADTGGEHELVIRPHHALWDGRFANNAWLQELPDPVSKVVWDNGFTLAPKTARGLGVTEGDMLTVKVTDRAVTLPAIVEPGVAEGVIVATLGHGRAAGGEVMKLAAGSNLAPLLGAENPAAPRLAVRATVSRAAGHRDIVRVQGSFSMHNRPIVLEGTLKEYRQDPEFVRRKRHLPAKSDMYDDVDYSDQHKWALSVDLNACVGCGACITACQAENNIPVVGRDECDNGREMHWIRVERYLSGDEDNPTVHHQPMMCQHCDHAPCENVCPVNATTHSPDGLNQMAYNRCVGTRYCSNNCPYKVRHFNFFRYQEKRLKSSVQELVFNPQVTVRSVGVMEKCTFCVQRISAAKFDPENRDKALKDGLIMTACQQACPAGAIRFGDANDEKSQVARNRENPRAYHVLEELNVQPNVTYLARVRNRDEDEGTSTDGKGRVHR